MSADGSDAIEFKMGVAALLDELIREAVERGTPTDRVYRKFSVEALELAARMYDGSDASFLTMAQRMLSLVRTGTVEQ
jgi:hypothetical protein